MQPAEVQTDEIIEAGQLLESQGRPVNGWTLRRALGDKGRPDHLIAVWQSHQGGVPVNPGDLDTVCLPVELAEHAERGRSELTALFDTLMVASFEHTDGVLKDRYKTEFDRLAAERDDVQAQLAAASASVSATEATLSKTLKHMEGMREALTAARDGVASSEKRIRAIEEQRARDARTVALQVTSFQEQATVLSAAAQHAQKKITAAESEAQHFRERAACLGSEIETARRESAARSAEIAALKAEKAGTQRRAERLEQDCAAAQKSAQAAHATAAASIEAAQQLRENVAKLTSALTMARDLVTTIRAELAAVKSDGTEQQKRAERAEEILADLREEQRKSDDTSDIVYIS